MSDWIEFAHCPRITTDFPPFVSPPGFAILSDMPANLTPQYLEAEKRFKAAETPQEKIDALGEMMSIIPKHKGTEKLRAELRKKLSALRKESTQKKSAVRKDLFHVDRQGARQLVLVGAPNAGKSSLLASLTHATPEIADYPFTTRSPIPGMLTFEEVHLQLVDLPPVSADHMESWVPQIIRNADAILWVADLSDDAVLDHLESTLEILRAAKVELSEKQTLIIGNKIDGSGARDREEILKEMYGDTFGFIRFSNRQDQERHVEDLSREVFSFLNLVRVYTKAPGKKAERRDPFVIARGSTVLDLAGVVHRELAENFKFAKVWGEGKTDGLAVSGDFVLDDGDIVELHAA